MQIAWTVVFTGLVVVFIVLIFLVYLVKGYGAVVRKLAAKPKPPKAESQPEVEEEHLAEPASAAEEGVPGEVAAAISAAVYSLSGEGCSVVSIRRTRTAGRSSWEMAGLFENTRPF